MLLYIKDRPVQERLAGLLNRVETVVKATVERLADSAQEGGYFCLLEETVSDLEEPVCAFVLICNIRIGSPANHKSVKYSKLAYEKAVRLAAYPDHLSSFQSRNAYLDRYGGAIRTMRHIFSFSGLPELEDESAMLTVAQEEDLFVFGRDIEIARLSGNRAYLEKFGATL
ncbi:MAG: hypothetical protein AAB518_03100 [Patescibacteria group bacterium]